MFSIYADHMSLGFFFALSVNSLASLHSAFLSYALYSTLGSLFEVVWLLTGGLSLSFQSIFSYSNELDAIFGIVCFVRKRSVKNRCSATNKVN